LSEKRGTSAWRKLAIAVYGAPKEGKIYGTYEVDVTEMVKYIQQKKKEGKRLTVTNFAVAAMARTLYEDIPDINCFVRRGRLVYREDADVFVTVSIKKGKGMTGLIVPKAHELSVSEIADYMTTYVERKRQGKESGAFAAKDVVAKIPWPFRRPIFLFIKWWVFDLGFKLPFLNMPRDPFGSIMLTNIGTFGLSTGMVALFPIGKLPAVVTMGKIAEKPVVVDGKVQVRSMLPFTGTFDHRIVDGAQAGKLAMGAKQRLANPQELDQPNREPSPA